MTDFTPCPKTIRLCIEALRDRDADRCFITALEALLPDQAEELVRGWNETGAFAKHMVEDHAVRNFARWGNTSKGVRSELHIH